MNNLFIPCSSRCWYEQCF